MKLYAAGVSGPLFDWLRMLYARMSYVVRQGSDLTDAFKSLIGVLTGDTASPVLWNVYFADLADADHDDICLSGRPISHLEQPDDVALFSTTADGLQRKLDLFFGWCRVNFMVISATKTEWMLFGELPTTIPRMMVGDKPIHLVKSYKFVGIIFTPINRDIFATHYTKKARAVANTTFAAKSMIGCLPPFDGIRMYDARIDPHLTFGCELSYRRPFLALGYLIYLITLPPNHLANAAYLDSLVLSNSGHPCWITDLQFVLQSLPVPIILSSKELDADKVVEIRKSVLAACEKWLGNLTVQYASSLS